MKANRLGLFLFFLIGSAVLQLPAQQSEADRKLLADVRAKAEKGEAQSQSALGRAFGEGTFGVAKDEVEAVKWYRKAAEQNYADAQAYLGACYLYGQGVVKDEAEAVKWFRKAAEQNCPSSSKFRSLLCQRPRRSKGFCGGCEVVSQSRRPESFACSDPSGRLLHFG